MVIIIVLLALINFGKENLIFGVKDEKSEKNKVAVY